ncbi:transglutaminase-like domain-containing protein, partial [Fluviicola sp.]|uniref:transglutaminase-like domain-containing protein n=1 Tax=Fluviicola sp. TaxID=1917219 RepID=UPI002615D867
MNLKTIFLFAFTTCISFLQAQTKMNVIKASSDKVGIRDGKIWKGEMWTIVPEANPDVYVTFNTQVTFITNQDSITVRVSPKNPVVDFVILLNGKDSARTQVKYQESYIARLKKAAKFNYSDKRFVPEFTYQALNDERLMKIRKDLKLDSIAGEGNEVSKIINLMHWVHNTVRHDGSSDNPVLKNALDLIQVCKMENRGINCRMMATILNECYLSMGIKSRHITCMPKETKFEDCHVINMVYSRDLKKWIWMDPTFDAYVMDEKGELLGVQEVRERLISGKTLILNPDANWNRRNSQTKEEYLDQYMAKNLYRLETPVTSEYDTETQKEGKVFVYIQLLPLDGLEQTPQKVESTIIQTGERFVIYKTNNPDLFWVKPE